MAGMWLMSSTVDMPMPPHTSQSMLQPTSLLLLTILPHLTSLSQHTSQQYHHTSLPPNQCTIQLQPHHTSLPPNQCITLLQLPPTRQLLLQSIMLESRRVWTNISIY